MLVLVITMMQSKCSDQSGKDVDELLLALEASVTNDSFLQASDEDIAKELFDAEQQNEEHSQLTGGNSSANDIQNDSGSMKQIESHLADDLPCDADFTNGLANDFLFQNNSAKLDDFLLNQNHSGVDNDGNVLDYISGRDSYGESLDEQPKHEGLTGKRRRTYQRRTSLPSMHLRYEDPFEPTPIFSPHQEHQNVIQQPDYHSGPPSKLAAVQVSNDGVEGFSSVRRRAPRRSSLPGMHLSSPVPELNNTSDSGCNDNDPSAFRVGRAQRRGSTGSFYRPVPDDSMFNFSERGNITDNNESNLNSFSTHSFEMSKGDGSASSLVIHEEKVVNDNEGDSYPSMEKLQNLMKRSLKTQKSLQQWDKDNGLPKSHSQTMVNTSRSRKQLQEGVILPKWDGSPLISDNLELGKPKPRNRNAKKEGGKIQRRMSAPATSNYVLN